MPIIRKKTFIRKNRVSRVCAVGSEIVCANTAAKKLKIIGVLGLNSIKRRRLSAGVGSILRVTVTSGPKVLKNKVMYALMIRQKYPYYREGYGKVRFLDNAAVLLEDSRLLRKGEIRGLIGKEVQADLKYVDIIGKCV